MNCERGSTLLLGRGLVSGSIGSALSLWLEPVTYLIRAAMLREGRPVPPSLREHSRPEACHRKDSSASTIIRVRGFYAEQKDATRPCVRLRIIKGRFPESLTRALRAAPSGDSPPFRPTPSDPNRSCGAGPRAMTPYNPRRLCSARGWRRPHTGWQKCAPDRSLRRSTATDHHARHGCAWRGVVDCFADGCDQCSGRPRCAVRKTFQRGV